MSDKNLPQLVYWRNGSPVAESLAASLSAEQWDARFNLVETPDQFFRALEHPRLHLIVLHAHLMTSEIVKKVQSSCPDSVLVVVCDDERKLPDDLRERANHVLNAKDLEQLPALLRRSLRNSTRLWSLKDERDGACEQAKMLNLVDEAVMGQRPDGAISTWNAAASKLFGWTEQEALGRPHGELLSILNGVGEKQIADALNATGHWAGELHYRGKDKREVHVNSRRSRIRDDASNGMIEICADLSDARIELRKARVATIAQALFAPKGAEGRALPLQECMEQFSKLIVPICADACAIYLLGEDDLIRRVALAARHPILEALVPESLDEFPIFPSNRRTALDAMRRSQPEIVSPVEDLAIFLGATNEGLKAELQKIAAASALTTAIHADGKPIGVIAFISTDAAHKFQEADKQRIAQFALTIGAAIERSRLNPNGRQVRPAQNDRSDSALYYKDAFLGAVSHELRTPLQAMFGWTQLMRDKKLTEPETEKALDALELSLNAQNKIVNDLLDLSRINSGKLELTPRPVQLKAMLENTLEAFHVSAAIKQINLRFNSTDPSPLDDIWVTADEAWLQRSLWNIFSNAVKFTPIGGSIDVELSADAIFAEVRIADTGIGIEPKFLPHIFEHFSQADMSTTRTHYGLGIGLAIAIHIVEAHGGSIDVASDGLNMGAAFTVKLPRCPAKKGAETQIDRDSVSSADNQAEISLAGVSILVVEDEQDTRNLLCFILQQAGATVAGASSAKDGLAALAVSKFDVLISDIGMPHEDGLSLIRKVRSLPPERNGRIPALALTAYATKEDRMQTLRAGYQMHAAKPVDISELLLIISALLNTVKK